MAKTISELSKELAEAREASASATSRVTMAYNAYKEAVTAERDLKPMGIEDALMTYHEDGLENERGYKVLKAMLLMDYDRGVFFASRHFPRTNQRVMTVRLQREWDDEKLRSVASVIEMTVWAIKPGALGNYDYGKEVPPTEYDGWRAFELSGIDDGRRAVYLAQTDDGRWAALEQLYTRLEVLSLGDLMSVLRYVRDNVIEDCDRE